MLAVTISCRSHVLLLMWAPEGVFHQPPCMSLGCPTHCLHCSLAWSHVSAPSSLGLLPISRPWCNCYAHLSSPPPAFPPSQAPSPTPWRMAGASPPLTPPSSLARTAAPLSSSSSRQGEGKEGPASLRVSGSRVSEWDIHARDWHRLPLCCFCSRAVCLWVGYCQAGSSPVWCLRCCILVCASVERVMGRMCG